MENAMLYAWEIKSIYALFGKENILHTPRKVPHMAITRNECAVLDNFFCLINLMI